MTKLHIHLVALIALAILAGALLFLIGFTFQNAAEKMTPDGKVPIADAGLFTAFLLSFQQVIGTMRSLWESQERATLAESISNSTPVDSNPPPQSAAAAAKMTAAAAQDEANHIQDIADKTDTSTEKE